MNVVSLSLENGMAFDMEEQKQIASRPTRQPRPALTAQTKA
jgi:hypothetical protein